MAALLFPAGLHWGALVFCNAVPRLRHKQDSFVCLQVAREAAAYTGPVSSDRPATESMQPSLLNMLLNMHHAYGHVSQPSSQSQNILLVTPEIEKRKQCTSEPPGVVDTSAMVHVAQTYTTTVSAMLHHPKCCAVQWHHAAPPVAPCICAPCELLPALHRACSPQ